MPADFRLAQKRPLLPVLPRNLQQPVKLRQTLLTPHQKMNRAPVLQHSFHAVKHFEIKLFRLRFPAQFLCRLRRLLKARCILKIHNRNCPDAGSTGNVNPLPGREDAVHFAKACAAAQLSSFH